MIDVEERALSVDMSIAALLAHSQQKLELELTFHAMLHNTQVFRIAVFGMKIECCVVMGETDQRFRYTLELQGHD